MPRSMLAGVMLASSASLLIAPSAHGQSADLRTPQAIAIQTGIERACLPLLEHQKRALTKSSGVEHDQNGAFLPVSGDEQLRITPPDAVNPTVCTMSLEYPAGARKGMLALLDTWSADHHLKPIKVDEPSRSPEDQRWTSTWEGQSFGGEMAIAFSADHPLSVASAQTNQATIQISLSPHRS